MRPGTAAMLITALGGLSMAGGAVAIHPTERAPALELRPFHGSKRGHWAGHNGQTDKSIAKRRAKNKAAKKMRAHQRRNKK